MRQQNSKPACQRTCSADRSAFYYTVRLATRMILTIFSSLKVSGAENVSGKGAYIIVANHINWFDGFVLIALFKERITFLAASYLFERPIIRRAFLTRMGCIPVGQAQTRKAITKSLKLLKDGEIIGVFPEGGVRLTKEMQGIKRGAFFLAHMAKVPIIPVSIQGTNHLFSSFRKIPLHREIIVNIGKPIYPVHGILRKATDRETAELTVTKITKLVERRDER